MSLTKFVTGTPAPLHGTLGGIEEGVTGVEYLEACLLQENKKREAYAQAIDTAEKNLVYQRDNLGRAERMVRELENTLAKLRK